MKIRLIWDECTPTRERRSTTIEDIDNDIHLEEFVNLEALLDKLLELTGYEIDDLETLDTEERINELLDYLSDPGDGSPNILFLSIDNKIVEDWLEDERLNGLTSSEEDVKDSLKNNFEEDELWESDYEISDDSDGYYDDDVIIGDKVKIVYGNSWKEAESNDPIEVDQKTLKQYKDNYSYIRILDDEDDEELDEAKNSVRKSTNPIINKLRRQLQETNNNKLTPEQEAYNKASELAKKIDKPIVYGYTKGGKFYSITPKAYHGDDKAFRSQYSANTIRVAYPDKPFAGRNLQEDLTDNLLDELKEVSKEDNISEACNKEEKTDWEKSKDQILEYYNKVKEWDGDHAKTRTSCYYNVGIDTLNEWLGEDK